ncbi:hypothetical protein BGX29_006876 [Mortierella sp. GBA35]|nr:hypothetical protein BGX29_006876 [Mortierella sp. GBA35]
MTTTTTTNTVRSLSTTTIPGMDPSSSTCWSSNELISLSPNILDTTETPALLSFDPPTSSTTTTAMHPSCFQIHSPKHLNTIGISPPVDSSNRFTATIRPLIDSSGPLSSLFLDDQSEDYRQTAQLLLSEPRRSPTFGFEMTKYDAGVVAMGLAQQQQQLSSQIGVMLSGQQQQPGVEGGQQSTPGWGLTETASLLLNDVPPPPPTRMPSTDDLWLEQFLQPQQPPPSQVQLQTEEEQQQQQQQDTQERQRRLRDHWLQQQQHHQQVVSTSEHIHLPQRSLWPWLPSDQQQFLFPQHSLQLEQPFTNPHHATTTMPADYLHPEYLNSVSSSFQHRYHHPLPYDSFAHPNMDAYQLHSLHQQQHQQQQQQQQQYPHFRRISHHHHHPQSTPPVVPSLKRRRRLATEESEFLMIQFNLNGRPTAQERDSFAKHLKLDRRTIQVWFQNRRAKLKRDERNVGCGVGGGCDGGEEGAEDEDGDDDDQGDLDYEDGAADMGGAVAGGRRGETEAAIEGDIGFGWEGGEWEGGECARIAGPGQEYQQLMQDTGEGPFHLLPQQHRPLPLPPPSPFDLLDFEGETAVDLSDENGLDFCWQGCDNSNDTSYYNTGNSSPSTSGEMMMRMGLAQTARLGMELFSSQQFHYQQHQHQYHHQDPALPHPLQRWSLPLVDDDFRGCPP